MALAAAPRTSGWNTDRYEVSKRRKQAPRVTASLSIGIGFDGWASSTKSARNSRSLLQATRAIRHSASGRLSVCALVASSRSMFITSVSVPFFTAERRATRGDASFRRTENIRRPGETLHGLPPVCSSRRSTTGGVVVAQERDAIAPRRLSIFHSRSPPMSPLGTVTTAALVTIGGPSTRFDFSAGTLVGV